MTEEPNAVRIIYPAIDPETVHTHVKDMLRRQLLKLVINSYKRNNVIVILALINPHARLELQTFLCSNHKRHINHYNFYRHAAATGKQPNLGNIAKVKGKHKDVLHNWR